MIVATLSLILANMRGKSMGIISFTGELNNKKPEFNLEGLVDVIKQKLKGTVSVD